MSTNAAIQGLHLSWQPALLVSQLFHGTAGRAVLPAILVFQE